MDEQGVISLYLCKINPVEQMEGFKPVAELDHGREIYQISFLLFS